SFPGSQSAVTYVAVPHTTSNGTWLQRTEKRTSSWVLHACFPPSLRSVTSVLSLRYLGTSSIPIEISPYKHDPQQVRAEQVGELQHDRRQQQEIERADAGLKQNDRGQHRPQRLAGA